MTPTWFMFVDIAGADRSQWKRMKTELSVSTVAFICCKGLHPQCWVKASFSTSFIVICLLQQCLQTWVKYIFFHYTFLEYMGSTFKDIVLIVNPCRPDPGLLNHRFPFISVSPSFSSSRHPTPSWPSHPLNMESSHYTFSIKMPIQCLSWNPVKCCCLSILIYCYYYIVYLL